MHLCVEEGATASAQSERRINRKCFDEENWKEGNRAQLCAYVKYSTLNSAIEQELRDRRVEGRANATSSA